MAVHYRGMAAICSKHEALKPLQNGFLQLAGRFEVSAGFYRELAQRIVDEKELKMIQTRQMKRILTLLMLVVLLATGGVSLAQSDGTIEPSPLTPLPQGEGNKTGLVMATLREKLLGFQPKAINIRFVGKCHCRANALFSYQLPGLDHDRGENEETCGYWCGACGFSNAGSRKKDVR